MEYRVIWEIDIEAASPEDAALEAENIMHDYYADGHRPVLRVQWPEGGSAEIDLETLD